MTTNTPETNERDRLKTITYLARTLTETAEELLLLTKRRPPGQEQILWIIRQAHTRIHEVSKNLGEHI
jgi:hypothetical protein